MALDVSVLAGVCSLVGDLEGTSASAGSSNFQILCSISVDQIDGLEAVIRSDGCDDYAMKHSCFL